MADFEYQIFDGLKTALAGAASCGTVDTDTPPSLPFIAFEQLSNPVATKYLDSGTKPRYYSPQYRITAYTADNDKVLAKELLELADTYMLGVGFMRTFGPQRVTSKDLNVLKMLSLYEGNLISTDGRVYTK